MRPSITLTFDPPTVEVRFSDSAVAHQFSGEVLADVNRNGNWVRGLEVFGSGIQFSLQHALSSLRPQPRSTRVFQDHLTVTYDEDANAGFLYLPYAASAAIERKLQAVPLLLKTSYTVADQKAVFGLSTDNILVSIRFKIPPDQNPETFLELYQT
jgi:hypothetical protein